MNMESTLLLIESLLLLGVAGSGFLIGWIFGGRAMDRRREIEWAELWGGRDGPR